VIGRQHSNQAAHDCLSGGGNMGGLMRGTDLNAILAVRAATSRRVTAAGGISTQEEIDSLDAQGVDAVVGMALYTGKLKLP